MQDYPIKDERRGVSTSTARDAVPRSKGHVYEEAADSVVNRGKDSQEKGGGYTKLFSGEPSVWESRYREREGAVRVPLKLLSTVRTGRERWKGVHQTVAQKEQGLPVIELDNVPH